MILSLDEQPEIHSTPVKIAREINIGCRSVSHIIDRDLNLCPLRKCKMQKRTNSNIE